MNHEPTGIEEKLYRCIICDNICPESKLEVYKTRCGQIIRKCTKLNCNSESLEEVK